MPASTSTGRSSTVAASSAARRRTTGDGSANAATTSSGPRAARRPSAPSAAARTDGSGSAPASRTVASSPRWPAITTSRRRVAAPLARRVPWQDRRAPPRVCPNPGPRPSSQCRPSQCRPSHHRRPATPSRPVRRSPTSPSRRPPPALADRPGCRRRPARRPRRHGQPDHAGRLRTDARPGPAGRPARQGPARPGPPAARPDPADRRLRDAPLAARLRADLARLRCADRQRQRTARAGHPGRSTDDAGLPRNGPIPGCRQGRVAALASAMRCPSTTPARSSSPSSRVRRPVRASRSARSSPQ